MYTAPDLNDQITTGVKVMTGKRRGTLRCTRAILLAFAVCAAVLLAAGPSALAQQALTPDEELAQRFAPVIILQKQDEDCDSDGEPFLPAPVDVVFGDDTVVLRHGPEQDPAKSPVSDADLFQLPDDFATDLPGRPRTPGCDYETHFKRVMGDRRPVIYAHIATEEGRRGIALQYWFFYYFNEFNNLHEGDWEMVQLLFDADSVAEALQQEPVQVAFAQHDSGELAAWDAPKLEKVGTRPVIYASRGSHASYYGPGLWLGWGQDGSGLGCDIANGEQVRIDPEVRLIPGAISGPDDPFAWVTFAGRWGEHDILFYNGPTGPALKPRWTAPVSWMENLRADSIRVNSAAIIGPAPTDIFCEVVGTSATLFTLSKPYPWLVAGIVGIGLALAGWAVWQSWPALRRTWRVYWPHLRVFAGIGGITVPITLLVSAIRYLLATNADFVAWFPVSEDDEVFQAVLSTVSTLQQGLLLLIVTPAVVLATGEIASAQSPSVRRALREGINRIPGYLWTLLRGGVVIILLAITVIGIPFSINRFVRWMLGPQISVLNDIRGKTALDESAAAVRGHWWQAAATGAVLTFLAATPGVIVGLLLMIAVRFPVDAANSVSSLVYAVARPFAIAGLTLLYLTWRGSLTSAGLPSGGQGDSSQTA